MASEVAVRRIQDLAADLEVGTSTREVCPECGGGSSRERSLAVTRSTNTMARFVCFRSSCSLGSGIVALYQEGGKILRNKTQAQTREIQEPDYFPLSEDAVEYLRKKYGLSDDLIRYSGVRLTSDKRLAFPVRGVNRTVVAFDIKKVPELYCGTRDIKSIPKSWKFIRIKEPNIAAWYRKGRHTRQNSKTLVVVEDIPSALRLVPYTDSVALLGTNFLRGIVQDIRSSNYDKVWLALDNDAVDKAFSWVKRLQTELPHMNVMFLERDIKNMDEASVQTLMRNYEVI